MTQTTSKHRTSMDPRGRTLSAWLDMVHWPTIADRTPEQARSDYQVLVSTTTRRTVGGWRRSTRAIVDDGVQVPVRVYWPRRFDVRRSARDDRPIVVWLHGGGFVVGDLFTADQMCRKIANYSGAVVVSADYRRTPESPLAAAHEDARTVVRWAYDHARVLGADPRRLIVAGDSAGGNLAAALTQHFRDDATARIAGQVLVYPATDLTLSHMDDHAANGFFDVNAIDWFGTHSLAGVDRTDPAISPLLAASHANLPPAHIVVGGADPFCPDGRAYAEALEKAGNEVVCEEYPRQIHGFVDMDAMFPAGHAALASMARTISMIAPVAEAPVPAEASSPIRWSSSLIEAGTRLDEAWLRTPMVNTGRIMSTLAAEYWRRPPVSAAGALTSVARSVRLGSRPKRTETPRIETCGVETRAVETRSTAASSDSAPNSNTPAGKQD
ncbi:alpha/beta hydrolase [Gordonia sp. TBRC 11910]|uniref:Alpha/beta hydrolase n=1 Tax=Gordonia asplenii TaxID=2725283 RepID=A0A848L0P7_9ACTN|nr:alpha/beta hydrolase [Gordonia asplenii]NMO02645.1 alpha/beta hydrolase [Gordonia asplenii]